ncbi:MAG TPA: sugar ABC transporter substrate-binding protein, partial [Lachnospiraceae bacterium]|nr:sugar ABC transporter substrate-binding protein [Lachnospiraceae bacterium]
MKKKILAVLLAVTMSLGLIACGKSEATSGKGGLIKVGIINNDPNESGYRTANDKDLKATFTEANGYEAFFSY